MWWKGTIIRKLILTLETGLFLFVFRKLFIILYIIASKDARFSYMFIVPILSFHLFIRYRKKEAGPVPFLAGSSVLVLGLSLYYLLKDMSQPTILGVAFVISLVGLLLVNTSYKYVRNILPSLVMLLLLFPLPNFINAPLNLNLQIISTQIATILINLSGVSASAQANLIKLPGLFLNVAEVCSGIGVLFSFVTFGAFLSLMTKTGLIKKTVLFLLSVPFAIIANSVRLFIVSLCYYYLHMKEHIMVGLVVYLITGFCYYAIYNAVTKDAE